MAEKKGSKRPSPKPTETDQKEKTPLIDYEVSEWYSLFGQVSKDELYAECHAIQPNLPGSLFIQLTKPESLDIFRTTLQELCLDRNQLAELKIRLNLMLDKKYIRFHLDGMPFGYPEYSWFGKYTFGKMNRYQIVRCFIHNEPQSFHHGELVAKEFCDQDSLRAAFPHFGVETYIQKVTSVMESQPECCQHEWKIVMSCIEDEWYKWLKCTKSQQ